MGAGGCGGCHSALSIAHLHLCPSKLFQAHIQGLPNTRESAMTCNVSRNGVINHRYPEHEDIAMEVQATPSSYADNDNDRPTNTHETQDDAE